MSIFGEIVEPGTRTAWEDWDDNIQEETPKLFWQKEVDVPDKIQTLFIFEGNHIADSLRTLTKFRLQPINFIQEVNLKLYRNENTDIYVCLLKDYNLLLASEIVDLLKPYIAVSNDVLAILTKPLVEYQATEYSCQDYIIRGLSTTKPVPKSLFKDIYKLEQPNIISGVSAGVISLREIQDQSGAVIVCYLEHNEEYQINELQGILTKLNFGPVQSQPNNILNSNLYI